MAMVDYTDDRDSAYEYQEEEYERDSMIDDLVRDMYDDYTGLPKYGEL